METLWGPVEEMGLYSRAPVYWAALQENHSELTQMEMATLQTLLTAVPLKKPLKTVAAVVLPRPGTLSPYAPLVRS